MWLSSFLFLLLPSCMVAPIRNIANKFFFSSTFSSSTTSNSQAFVLPTMFSSNHMGMNIPTRPVSVNGFEIRGRTPTTEKNYSREMSISSTQSSVIYHERMANNGMDIDPEPANNSLDLSYKTEQEKALYFSKATEVLENMGPPILTLNVPSMWIKANDFCVTQHLKLTITMSSTSSSRIIRILLLNWTSGAVASTQYLFMDQLNKLHWTLKASRTR